jgi:hypothetical protein
MKITNTPSAKSALFIPQPINADIADIAGGLSEKINEARAAALTLTDTTFEVFMALCSSGDKAKTYRAMRHYFWAVDLYISIERNLEDLP